MIHSCLDSSQGAKDLMILKVLWRVYLSYFISWCCYLDWYELKTILNAYFCVEWIINCLSNNQKFTPRIFEVLTKCS